jgi:hypothetical protein
MIKCHIPQAWQVEIQAIATRLGCNVEQIIYEAIAQYLSKNNANRLLEIVESSNSKADAALLQVLTLAARVTALEQVHLQTTARIGVLAIVPGTNDTEDEPDEILTSFLESDDFQERAAQSISPLRVAKDQSLPPTYEEFEDEADEILYDFIES